MVASYGASADTGDALAASQAPAPTVGRRRRHRPRGGPAPGALDSAAEAYAVLTAYGVPRETVVALLGERATALAADEQVAARIRQIIDARRARPEDLVAHLTALARADVRQLFDPSSGDVKPPAEWPADVAMLVQYYSVNRQGTIFVRLVDRARVLELLGRHLGIFEDHIGKANLLTRVLAIPPERLSELTDDEITQAASAARLLDDLCRRLGAGPAADGARPARPVLPPPDRRRLAALTREPSEEAATGDPPDVR